MNLLINGDPTFTASIGWLDHWKKRHNVRTLLVTGEKLSTDHIAAGQFKKQMTEIITDYSP